MILHVCSGNLFGGIETNLVALCAADRARIGFPNPLHRFALSFDGSLAGRLRELGCDPAILGPVRFRYPWTAWSARRRLVQRLGDPAIAGLVAHGSWAFRLAQPAARKAGKPIAFWNHDPFRGEGPLESFVVEHPPDFLIANSQYTAKAMEKALGGAVDRVIHPVSRHRHGSVPPDARGRLRAEFETPDDAVVIVLFSRFEPLKGHSVLLDALHRLKTRSDWVCWLVGGVQKPAEAAYQASLRQFATSAGLEDRIRFLGQRDDIPALLASADIHCQPNVGPDSFGLTYVEALEAGLPSVGSDLGGVPEILTPDCGRLVEPGDSKGLAATLAELIADEPMRQRLGAHGRERARPLRDVDAALKSLESLFAAPRNSGAAS